MLHPCREQERIEASIEADRDFLVSFDPARDRAAFEKSWAERGSGARAEVDSFEPHYEGSAVVDGPVGGHCSAHGSHMFIARPGHHLAPQPLSDGRNVFDALGDGFTLLAFGADDGAVAVFEQAAAASGLPLTVVRDSRNGGREQYNAALVLVRPDQFVAWTADRPPTDVAALLRRVSGRQ